MLAAGVRLPQLAPTGGPVVGPGVGPIGQQASPNGQQRPSGGAGANSRLGRPPTMGGGGGGGGGGSGKLSRMGQGPFTCNCGQVFPNLDIMERHMAALHPDNTNLVSISLLLLYKKQH